MPNSHTSKFVSPEKGRHLVVPDAREEAGEDAHEADDKDDRKEDTIRHIFPDSLHKWDRA